MRAGGVLEHGNQASRAPGTFARATLGPLSHAGAGDTGVT